MCEGLASILLGPETGESGRNDWSPERAYCVVRHTCVTSSLFSDGDCGGALGGLGPDSARSGMAC